MIQTERVQKQPSRGVLKERCSKNMQQIFRTPHPKNTSVRLLLRVKHIVKIVFGKFYISET